MIAAATTTATVSSRSRSEERRAKGVELKSNTCRNSSLYHTIRYSTRTNGAAAGNRPVPRLWQGVTLTSPQTPNRFSPLNGKKREYKYLGGKGGLGAFLYISTIDMIHSIHA